MLVKAHENILVCFHSKYISALSHAENVVLYPFSGSKYACNIFGKCLGSGSYWTIQKTEKELAKIPPRFPVGDIIVVYDNNQVIGKHYRVSWAGSIPQSAVCGITILKTEQQNDVQRNYSVTNILPVPLPRRLLATYDTFLAESNSINRKYRSHFIQGRLDYLGAQTGFERGILKDPISDNVFIGFAREEETLQYSRVPEDPSHCTIHDQECLILNPNSEESILKVLEHVTLMSIDSDPQRKW
jgi:hypothetical protein